ncbi:corrinoid protein [Desulfatitalea alkaliphila]|uniref:Corrinoid protein n=1 Tax=Desulfatitalea alkaliphila TaxID=2929485 RepID=A0AA41R5W0_9BACT|nr:corrinoid protein [Desulfatitalea alkaliphila]MCJ8501665.1 corrinoid protein [Desulfatitalea alkaliphila]
MNQTELIEKINFNIIQGRMTAEDEGFDEGLEGQPAVTELIEQAVEAGIDAKIIVLDGLTGAMETVGAKFDKGEYLIPDMLASAECVGAAMDILAPLLADAGVESKGKFVLATVAGDLHDIGKNIVAIMLKGAGFEVLDLGNDVTTGRIVEAVKANNAQFLGLSALLTTTMREMGVVIKALEESGLRDQVRVLIGGAPTSEAFAAEIGADAHCRDAFHAIDLLRQMAA